MKSLKPITVAILVTTFLAAPLAGWSADSTKKEKVKPYVLKTCSVSDEKLGEMGDPYVFTHDGKEYKLCCKGCLKDFNKNPAKYAKKVEKAEAKAKKKATS